MRIGKVPFSVLIPSVMILLAVGACTPASTKPPEAATPTSAATKPPAAVVGSPTPAPPKPAPPATRATVRVSSVGSISDAPIYIAAERGHFKEQGLDVSVMPFQTGPMTIAPLSSGELEVGGGASSPGLLNAIDRGIPMKFVATKGASREGFAMGWFTVRKDLIDSGQVKEIKDLRGRKIAVPSTQSGTEAMAVFVLNRGGITAKDVELVTLSQADMVAGFANKGVDAAVQSEPSLTLSVERGLVARWPLGSISAAYGGESQSSVMIFSAAFSKDIDVARRFMVAYVKGIRDYNDAFSKGKGKSEVVSILTKNTAEKDPASYDKMETTYMNPDGKMHLPSMQMDLDYFKQNGYYTGKLELKDVVDTQFVDYAAQQLGPYR